MELLKTVTGMLFNIGCRLSGQCLSRGLRENKWCANWVEITVLALYSPYSNTALFQVYLLCNDTGIIRAQTSVLTHSSYVSLSEFK